MSDLVRLAVVGAGLIGKRHIDAIGRSRRATCATVVEPNPVAGLDAPIFPSLTEMLRHERPDGVILSTPTPLHAQGAIEALRAGLPVLIEKPLTATLEDARHVTQLAEATGIPVLVGHHRRHNPLILAAQEALKTGCIGQIRAVQATCWFYKPDAYFDEAPWRKTTGGGPLSVNLVHDIDLLRLFCGEVVSVQACCTPARRGYDTEDLAAAILHFEEGTVATLSVSDAIAAPWSWEMTSAENPVYPFTGQSCYLIGGSEGALSLPDLRLWRHQGKPDWWSPMDSTTLDFTPADPLVAQIDHFAEVINGTASPRISAYDGMRNIQVIEAIRKSAVSGNLEHLPRP